MRKLVTAATIVLAVLVGVSGCATALSSTGTPLTVEQSEQLASARFGVYAGGEYTAEISYRDEEDIDHVSATLTVDPATKRAWGEISRGPAGLAVSEPVMLTQHYLVVNGATGWQESNLPDPARAAMHAVFLLAYDRPDNASLLRQTDAVYLGEAAAGGVTYSVFRLPSADSSTGSGETGDTDTQGNFGGTNTPTTGSTSGTRLWLDPDGRLKRLDVSDGTAFSIQLTDATPAPQPSGAATVWGILEQQ